MARARSSVLISPPREVFTTTAVGFMRRSDFSQTTQRVSAVSGAWRVRMSEARNSSSRLAGSTPSAAKPSFDTKGS